ncbi:hypothetical protein COU91_00095 [Candidatus Saccharibacteria bacterium CG10_big_fil_rev_8_21_14_0_10_47_8]|nr:MAG: hypothetical protein COU91_00095 [Candidatus Saccharibacteria bacterium CG10_big_fil_rev_8_21_14_0_10_47_8]
MTHEIPREQNGDQDLKTAIKEKTEMQITTIVDLAREIGGEGAHIDDVFPLPPETRDHAPIPEWNEDQVNRVREVARSFGYGAVEDVPSGLRGGVRIAEGGKVWKILAEAELIDKDGDPTDLVFAGSPHRQLGDDELDFLKTQYSEDFPPGTTEYQAAAWVAKLKSDGAIAEQPADLSIGYEIAEGNPVVRKAMGQVIEVGQTSRGQRVVLLKIDRENYQEEDGKPKYRHQPDTARVMGILSEALSTQGRHEDPVGFVTSNTYASRQVAITRAGLQNGRQFGVAMYGRETLIGLNASVPAETPLNHLPGDLRVMYENLQKLLAEVSQ